MVCPYCGKPVGPGARFCTHCGKPLAQPRPAPAGPANNTSTVRIVDDQSAVARFRVQCEYCYCTFEYGIRDLGYRAWYPHGFVYCPKCRKPLRHKLEYRIDNRA